MVQDHSRKAGNHSAGQVISCCMIPKDNRAHKSPLLHPSFIHIKALNFIAPHFPKSQLV